MTYITDSSSVWSFPLSHDPSNPPSPSSRLHLTPHLCILACFQLSPLRFHPSYHGHDYIILLHLFLPNMYFDLSSIAVVLCLFTTANATNNNKGPDYESLPHYTIFPGPWESNIRAPFNKSYIQPAKIFAVEGPVSGGESVLKNADSAGGIPWIISPGGMITFEFEENISGRYVAVHCPLLDRHCSSELSCWSTPSKMAFQTVKYPTAGHWNS